MTKPILAIKDGGIADCTMADRWPDVDAAMEAHINDLRRRAEAGDQDAINSLACFILIAPDK